MTDACLQKTIASPISARGVGVHSGLDTTLRFLPAPEDTGIVFIRTDVTPHVHIPAQVDYVTDCSWSTTIGREGVQVSTIEHLLSAVVGLGIDNLWIEIDQEEVPIMDGSAAPFIFLFQSAGLVEQPKAYKKVIKILKKVSYEDGDKLAEFSPSDRLTIDLKIDFDHPLFTEKNQKAEFEFSTTSFIKEISRARTFGFLKDLEYLKANHLAKGGSLKNAVVLDDSEVVNPEGLRYVDECVRHKILDAIGDLSMMGHPIIGAFKGIKSGHFMNHQLLCKLREEDAAYEIVSLAPSAMA